jgi:hypothetical protein
MYLVYTSHLTFTINSPVHSLTTTQIAKETEAEKSKGTCPSSHLGGGRARTWI